MAKTLLNGINEILKRVGEIAGDAGSLTTLTDSSRQHIIDLSVQVINEGIVKLYSETSIPLPSSQGESTITLSTSTRNYTLASDLVQLRWPMVDKTNTQFLKEYPGGYNQILLDDPEQDDTGLPLYGAIRPTDGALYLDRAPTSTENGRVYTYQYDKSLLMDEAADTMPFTDEVFTMMVPVWVQLWKREKRNEFDQALYVEHLGSAARLLTRQQPRSSYSPR